MKKLVNILIIIVLILTSTIFSSGYLKCYTLETAHLNCHLEEKPIIESSCCGAKKKTTSESLNNICCEQVLTKDFSASTFSTDKVKLIPFALDSNFIEYFSHKISVSKEPLILTSFLANHPNKKNLYQVKCVYRC